MHDMSITGERFSDRLPAFLLWEKKDNTDAGVAAAIGHEIVTNEDVKWTIWCSGCRVIIPKNALASSHLPRSWARFRHPTKSRTQIESWRTTWRLGRVESLSTAIVVG